MEFVYQVKFVIKNNNKKTKGCLTKASNSVFAIFGEKIDNMKNLLMNI